MHSHATQSTHKHSLHTFTRVHTHTLIIYGGVNGSSGVSSVGIPSGSGISDFGSSHDSKRGRHYTDRSLRLHRVVAMIDFQVSLLNAAMPEFVSPSITSLAFANWTLRIAVVI